jgi:putative hydrolase of the HAD superfamily
MLDVDRARAAPLRAILLDALGTLVDLAPPWEQFVRLLGERHGIDIAVDDARRALLAEMGYYRAACIRAGDAKKLAVLRAECAGIVANELGGDVAALAPATLVKLLLDSLHFSAYADVVSALRRWREDGLRLVVVSNWDVSLHEVLRDVGLRELLDGVVSSAEIGAAKPAPAIFAAGLELAGCRADEAIHIGDSISEDVVGARGAGIEAVLLRREGASTDALELPGGVRVLASLREW